MVLASRWSQLAMYFGSLGIPVALVDLESTGGDLYKDRIIEIAILRFENGTVRQYEWLVNPQKPISEFIARLTGIDDNMVVNAPVFSDIADILLPLLRGALLIAHNSRFDYTFLRHEFQRIGIHFASPALCTVQLSRRLYPQYRKHNLDSIIERFQIDVKQRHRAMTDVLALADFLEKSFTEKGHGEWERQFHALTQPKVLPQWLSNSLSKQIYALPDIYGVSVWLDKNGKAVKIDAHEKAFSEISASLQSITGLAFTREISEIRFIPALGKLHALREKAQLGVDAGIRPSEINSRYFTVQFSYDESSCLRARVAYLISGYMHQPPTGLFLHKKSAKRALAIWANEYGLCPFSLGILPASYACNPSCPVKAIGHCSGSCYTENGIELQNRKIINNASLLPIVDWGSARRIEIVECDALSGQKIVLNCAGGALELSDGRWYFDHTLPKLLKEKFKLGRKAVQVIEAV